MSLADVLDAPLFGGVPVSTSVPGQYEVSIAGHAYMIDHAADLNGFRGEHFSEKSIPVQRNQADVGVVPSEQTLNREGLWRRSTESWHHGSGQNVSDRADSDPYRFNTSKGVNVWDKNTLSLLPATSYALGGSTANMRLASVGDRMYAIEGTLLRFSDNLDSPSRSFTYTTDGPGPLCTWIVGDGYTCYAAFGTGGVYTTTVSTNVLSPYVTGTVNLLGYVKGRLMAAAGRSLYNITASGALPAALLTHANADFQWVGFAEGPGFIYAAGYSGSASLIYKITLQPDGTALSAPIVAGELPFGETVRTVKGYAGFLLVGTDMGVRLASIDGQGNLTFGPLIPTAMPVLNFQPQGRFVWYGLSNYDQNSTGLGRLDLSVFTQPLAPAYASDLMSPGQGEIGSISTYKGLRVFVVDAQRMWIESRTAKAPAGSLSNGKVTFGIGDDKVGMYVDLRHQPLDGTVDVNVSANSGTSVLIGSSNAPGSNSNGAGLVVNQVRAETFEVTLTLNRADVTTLGPVVTRTTLRAYPAPARSFLHTLPLIFHTTLRDLHGTDQFMDVLTERLFLKGLCKTQDLIVFQEGALTFKCLIDDVTFIPVKGNRPEQGNPSYDGTMVVTLREVGD